MEDRYRYMLLSRYQRDVQDYLGWGNRSSKIIDDPRRHIETMRELHNSFTEDQKPRWLTLQQIDEYERMMLDTPDLPSHT